MSQKAQALSDRWEEMWQRRQEAETKLLARETHARSKEDKLNVADIRTEQAEREIHKLENILSQGISQRTESHWDLLKDNRSFLKPKPAEPYFPLPPYFPDPVFPLPPTKPVTPEIPKKPIPPDPSERVSRNDPRFQPVISALDRMVLGRVEKKTKEAEDLFLVELEVWNNKIRTYNHKVAMHNAYLVNLKRLHQEGKQTYRTSSRQYEEECRRIRTEHDAFVERTNREHNEQLNRLQAKHLESLNKWEQEKKAILRSSSQLE